MKKAWSRFSRGGYGPEVLNAVLFLIQRGATEVPVKYSGWQQCLILDAETSGDKDDPRYLAIHFSANFLVSQGGYEIVLTYAEGRSEDVEKIVQKYTPEGWLSEKLNEIVPY